MLVAAPAAFAQDATWLDDPWRRVISARRRTGRPGAVPTGFATFGVSSVTTLTFSAIPQYRRLHFQLRRAGLYIRPHRRLWSSLPYRRHHQQFRQCTDLQCQQFAADFRRQLDGRQRDHQPERGHGSVSRHQHGREAQLNAAAGTTFDFTGTTGPAANGVFSAGSISGEGNFDLGASNRLVVGSNDLSTTVSGTISSGAITKVGAAR